MSSLSEPTYLLDDHAMREAAKRIGQGVDAEAVCKLIRDTYEAELAALRQRVTHKDALINQLTEIDMAAMEDEIDRLRQQVTELTAQLPSQQIAVTVRAALEDARSRAANATWIMTNMQRDQAAQELLDALNWLRKLQRGEEGAE